MKKSVRLVRTILVISIFILLVSCKPRVPQGETPLDTSAALKAVQSGTQGVEIRPLSNYPPPTIYDQNELIAILEVNNKGNHDLEPQDCFVRIVGFDPNIIRGDFIRERSCAENIGALEGKNIYNLEGSSNQIEFRASDVALPLGTFEYNPQLSIRTCYNYHTKATPQICVDPLLYQITSEQKTCQPRDVSLGVGQGGPVGVSYVGVDMVGNKAIFEINVRNYGSGRVLSQGADIQSCGDASLDYKDLDRVLYDVQLSGGSVIDCKPRDGSIRLNNGQGKIVCSFSIPGTMAYETPLIIDLDYGYLESEPMNIKIIKTPN